MDATVIAEDNFQSFKISLILALGNASDAIEITCIGFIISSMKDVTASQKEFLSAAVFAGMLLGTVLGGRLSDMYGRRPCLLAFLSFNTIGSFLSIASVNVSWLVFFRIISGIGIGGSVPICFTLGIELFPHDIRGRLVSIIGSFWMIGSVYAALTAWLILGNNFSGIRFFPNASWKTYACVAAIPSLISLLLSYLYVPESPSYLMLVSKSNITKSQSKLYNDSDVYCLDKSTMQLNIVILILIWFTLSYSTYGIIMWISILFEDVGINNNFADSVIFSLANLPGNIISIFYLDSIGAKRMLFCSMFLGAICSFIFGFDSTNFYVVIFASSIFNACSSAGWNALDCLSVELFPTKFRTTTIGILSASGRLGSIAAQFANGNLESNITLLLYSNSIIMLFGSLCSLFISSVSMDSIDNKKGNSDSLSLIEESENCDEKYSNSIELSTIK